VIVRATRSRSVKIRKIRKIRDPTLLLAAAPRSTKPNQETDFADLSDYTDRSSALIAPRTGL